MAVMTRTAARTLLKLREKYTTEELKRAYRTAARREHPDHGGSDKRMQLVNDAFKVLSTPEPKPAAVNSAAAAFRAAMQRQQQAEYDAWKAETERLYAQYQKIEREREAKRQQRAARLALVAVIVGVAAVFLGLIFIMVP
jgi:curved DNA-binding protein CbpA